MFNTDSRVRDRIIELNEFSNSNTIDAVSLKFGNSAYVVESVPLALFAAQQFSNLTLEQILVAVVEAGGDTDTIASMTGQIVGFWIGASQISKLQIQKLPNLFQLNNIANEIFMLITKS